MKCLTQKPPTHAFESLAYHKPVIFMSFGGFAPRSVSDGWIDWKTPAISPVAASTFAVERTIDPLRAAVFLVFSLASSSSSPRAGRATAVSYPVDPPRPLGSKKEEPRYDGTLNSPPKPSNVPAAFNCFTVSKNGTRSPPGS